MIRADSDCCLGARLFMRTPLNRGVSPLKD
jgi:hypothetical protein